MQMRAETRAALTAVETALKLMRRRAGAELISSKGGRDLVTATDVAVEDAVRSSLLAAYPGWTVVGEERGGEDQVGDRPFWLVDPICGTRNFASNLPLYCVNVALVEDGEITVAAVGDGGTGDRYIAERGQGAYQVVRNGPRAIRASGASLTIDVAVGDMKPGDHHRRGANFMRAIMLADRWEIRNLGTSAVAVHTASGRLAGNITFLSSGPVHTAAGTLLCAEAGATVTDHQGERWTIDKKTLLVAATPELHGQLMELIATTGG
jgi:myo-inositol-1(or 4)-monophosphatase